MLKKFLFAAFAALIGAVCVVGCGDETNEEEVADAGVTGEDVTVTPNYSKIYAGVRSSSYGAPSPFPSPDYWAKTMTSMANRFENGVPSAVWIVGVLGWSDTGDVNGCHLGFPNPDGGDYPHITFSETDMHEDYLKKFDEIGAEVWLQVESGFGDIPTLIDLMLKQYGHHPSVIGVGIDVEWHRYEEEAAPEGVAVTDEQARAWSMQTRAYNPDYRIFFKHWLTEKMPPTYRNGVMFLNDSQEFATMAGIVREFVEWANHFKPARVGFQYGYSADSKWWSELSDPPGEIGRELLAKTTNTSDLFWVDFTLEDVWPILK